MSIGAAAPRPAERVARGAAAAAVAAAALAALRGAPAGRSAAAGAALAGSFLAVREALVRGGGEGPAVSAVAGGVAGYFGALAAVGPSWAAVTRGAAVGGVGCGVLDAVLRGLDWRRKVYAVAAEEERALRAAGGGGASVPADVAPWWTRWPVWFPVLKQVDCEYEELLRRREATLLALEEEQGRIAALLEALELVKARKHALAADPCPDEPLPSTKVRVRTSRTMSDVTDPASPPVSPPASP